MRHRKSGRKLNRNSSHRSAMFRNMVTSLLKYESITTTDAKAKELRSLADHVVTLAKRGDLHARRQVLSIVREQGVVHKLFDGAKERFGEIPGGYTRIVKIGTRPGDAAPVSVIQLVAADKAAPKKKGKKKKAKASAEKALPAAAASSTVTESAQTAAPAADTKTESPGLEAAQPMTGDEIQETTPDDDTPAQPDDPRTLPADPGDPEDGANAPENEPGVIRAAPPGDTAPEK